MTLPDTLVKLRHRIAAIEGGGPRQQRPDQALAFGLPAIDAHLPWQGLPSAAVHEVVDGGRHGARVGAQVGHGGAATAFTAALLGRRQRETGRPVFWIAARESLCGHGLAAYGLEMGALILVRATSPVDAQWAMEEALREPGVGAVVGEIAELGLTASRRLQLAAEVGGVTGILLRPDTAEAASPNAATEKPQATPSACVTRWRVRAAASGPARPAQMVGPARWQVELLRCRACAPRQWLVEWENATGCFALAAPLPDRPAVPAAGRAGATQWPTPRRLAG